MASGNAGKNSMVTYRNFGTLAPSASAQEIAAVIGCTELTAEEAIALGVSPDELIEFCEVSEKAVKLQPKGASKIFVTGVSLLKKELHVSTDLAKMAMSDVMEIAEQTGYTLPAAMSYLVAAKGNLDVALDAAAAQQERNRGFADHVQSKTKLERARYGTQKFLDGTNDGVRAEPRRFHGGQILDTFEEIEGRMQGWYHDTLDTGDSDGELDLDGADD